MRRQPAKTVTQLVVVLIGLTGASAWAADGPTPTEAPYAIESFGVTLLGLSRPSDDQTVPTITKAEATKLLGILKPWFDNPFLAPAEAKAVYDQIQASLNADQLARKPKLPTTARRSGEGTSRGTSTKGQSAEGPPGAAPGGLPLDGPPAGGAPPGGLFFGPGGPEGGNGTVNRRTQGNRVGQASANGDNSFEQRRIFLLRAVQRSLEQAAGVAPVEQAPVQNGPRQGRTGRRARPPE